MGIVLVSMAVFVFHSKADSSIELNPYLKDLTLSSDDIINNYNIYMNNEFNYYISMLMASMSNPTAPTDPNGTAFKSDGTPMQAADCLANPKNYSTFCVAVNVLGANADDCPALAPGGKLAPPATSSDGLQAFCTIAQSASSSPPLASPPPALSPSSPPSPLYGYLDFVAALKMKQATVFANQAELQAYQQYQSKPGLTGLVTSVPQNLATVPGNLGISVYDEISASTSYFNRTTNINQALDTAKKTLDQTLSAYDQLRMAWPMHQQYVQIYADLVKYRDKIVNIRHETDIFPQKFVDVTTTACE